MMQDKRGVSVLHVQRQLGLSSYGTTWQRCHKIREALHQRDDRYELLRRVELDGVEFRKHAGRTTTQETDSTRAFVAVESVAYTDKKGKERVKAGFMKAAVFSSESGYNAIQFADGSIADGTDVKTDGNKAFGLLPKLKVTQKSMLGNKELLDKWLPLVHRIAANTKRWLMGTHHGVSAKYLSSYLAEYVYRFNRRHDLRGLFHRAVYACASATPKTLGALLG